jgi:hypothetical protein
MARRSCRVLCNGNFETLLEQITQVRFGTHVRQHTAENDFADAAFAQLQNEVIGLRTKYPVRTDTDRLAVINVRFEASSQSAPDLEKPSRLFSRSQDR